MPLPEARPRAAILLSTFNGARFLPEQLASFSAQTHAQWTLHWRDDGSRDDTVPTMRRFAETEPRCIEHAEPVGNVGVLASYMRLLRDVAPTLGEADAVAFADQDDVWLPEKLARGLAALGVQHGPALYCARYVLTDAALQRIGLSETLRRPAGFPQSLTQNIATGCTILLNRPAAQLIAASAPPPGTLHDWWCYLVVSAAGGAIVRDATPVLLYRQHGGNTVGAVPNWAARAVAALRRGSGVFMALLAAHVAALLARPEALTDAALADLTKLEAALRGQFLKRLAALAMPGLRRQGWWETLVFRAWFATGRTYQPPPSPTS